MTELTELIRIKSSPISDDVQDSVEFVRFFPDFVWTVRDFMLELEFDGNPITEDEYLENALKLIPGINWKGQGGRKISRRWDQEPYMTNSQQTLSSMAKN